MKNRITVRVHPAGAAIFAAAFLFWPSREVIAAAAALLWHEAAHLAVMRLCGARACTVELTPFGGMADMRLYEQFSPLRQALCAGAGIAASAAAFAFSHAYGQSGGFLNEFADMNLSLLAVNCLPVWPLDGARVLVALASKLGREHAVRKALALLAWAAGIGLAALGLYGAWLGWLNPSLLLGGPYLCYAASQGMLAHRVRHFRHALETRNSTGVSAVTAIACPQGTERAAAAAILGRREKKRCYLLLVMDPRSGRIRRVVTEQEMLEDIVGLDP